VVASPKGGTTTCDPASGDATAFPDLYKLSQETVPLSSVDPAGFDAVFYVGGFGAMFGECLARTSHLISPSPQRAAASFCPQQLATLHICLFLAPSMASVLSPPIEIFWMYGA